jgi:hypothetical protein
MKYMFCFGLALVSWSASTWAHGNIEKIECKDAKNEFVLEGVQTKTPNQLSFQLTRSKQSLGPAQVAALELKDVVNDGKITEQISIALEGKGTATLLIPEVYELEVRPGSGQMEMAANKEKLNLSCQVTY